VIHYLVIFSFSLPRDQISSSFEEMIKNQIEEIRIYLSTFMKNFLAMRNMALEYKIKVNRAGLCLVASRPQ
jgi:hypothetical protein